METLGRVRLHDIAVVLLLVFFGLAGAIPGIAPNQSSEMTGIPASHLQAVIGIGAQLVVNAMIVGFVLRHGRLFTRGLEFLRWPLALAVWALLSTCWSASPSLTGRRALPFLFAAMFGAVLAVRLPTQRFLLLLQVAFALLACWSAVLAVGFPSIGLDASTGHGGDWQGVFTQKNACGRAMVLAMASVLCALPSAGDSSRRFSPFHGLLLTLFVAELFLSGSRGAWLIGAILAAVLLAFRASSFLDRRTRTVLLAGAGCAAATLALAASAFFSTIAPLLGRDATLTGRTAIWHQVWLAILHRPWLGYGFSAFWQGASGPSWSVVVALHFVLFHAHNGFLEIWLELGAVGLLLFAATFLRACVLLWPELRNGHFAQAAWPAAILLLVVLYNLDENTLLSFNGLFWVLYSGALAQVEMLAAERKSLRRLIAQSVPAIRPRPLLAAFSHPNPVGRDPYKVPLASLREPVHRRPGSPWL